MKERNFHCFALNIDLNLPIVQGCSSSNSSSVNLTKKTWIHVKSIEKDNVMNWKKKWRKQVSNWNGKAMPQRQRKRACQKEILGMRSFTYDRGFADATFACHKNIKKADSVRLLSTLKKKKWKRKNKGIQAMKRNRICTN